MPDFQEISKASPFIDASYAIDVEFGSLLRQLEEWTERPGLDLNPDFQRGHVWTDDQRAAYVLYLLQGGRQGREIYFAGQGWSYRGNLPERPLVIVDGKQRLESVLRWIKNELPVLGALRSEWTGGERMSSCRLKLAIADIDRASTLRWYLALNEGATPHTAAELQKVRALLAVEAGEKLRKAALALAFPKSEGETA
jgi:hypothetical protein